MLLQCLLKTRIIKPFWGWVSFFVGPLGPNDLLWDKKNPKKRNWFCRIINLQGFQKPAEHFQPQPGINSEGTRENARSTACDMMRSGAGEHLRRCCEPAEKPPPPKQIEELAEALQNGRQRSIINSKQSLKHNRAPTAHSKTSKERRN